MRPTLRHGQGGVPSKRNGFQTAKSQENTGMARPEQRSGLAFPVELRTRKRLHGRLNNVEAVSFQPSASPFFSGRPSRSRFQIQQPCSLTDYPARRSFLYFNEDYFRRLTRIWSAPNSCGVRLQTRRTAGTKSAFAIFVPDISKITLTPQRADAPSCRHWR